MSAPYYSVGDPFLAFLVSRPDCATIEKVACVVKEQRVGVLLADSEMGTRYCIVNGWVQCIVHAEAKFGEGIFSRLHFDPDDIWFWQPYSPLQGYAEQIPWIDKNTHGLWCIYTRETMELNYDLESETGSQLKRTTFIGFEEEVDAIHYKLRWIG